MLANIDKFFIMALQEEGYEIDFKKFKEIYTKSRQHPECKTRAREKRELNELMFSSVTKEEYEKNKKQN